METGLATGERNSGITHFRQGHGQHGDGDLLTGGEHHVQLPFHRVAVDLFRHGYQLIGGLAHG